MGADRVTRQTRCDNLHTVPNSFESSVVLLQLRLTIDHAAGCCGLRVASLQRDGLIGLRAYTGRELGRICSMVIDQLIVRLSEAEVLGRPVRAK